MCIANVKVSRLLNEYIKICDCDSDYVFINKLGNRYLEQSIRNMISVMPKGVELIYILRRICSGILLQQHLWMKMST